MTTIDDVSTNDMNLKHLDTTKDIVITPRNEFGGQVLLNADHTWTAKVSDGNNYIGDYPVKLDSNGIVVNSAEFTKLPAGQYHLEVWEEWIDSNSNKQRTIYPSPQRTIDFTIYQNITDLAEKEIKTIGFQDVVDQAVTNVWDNYVIKVNMIESDQTATVVQSVADGKNYVTFNIPRGLKGDPGDIGPAPTLKMGTVAKLNPDQTPTVNLSGGNGSYTLNMGIPQGQTGTVDNTGLTNAPAFQALQTQVNDSAVGTNLFSQSTATPGYISGAGDVAPATHANEIMSDYIPVSASSAYTFQLRGTTPSGGYCWGSIGEYDSNKNFILRYTLIGSNQSTDTIEHLSKNITTTSTTAYVRVSFSKYNDYKAKLEKGSVATDWSPNPTEILTQADYAKIQAAIVALGGSLS